MEIHNIEKQYDLSTITRDQLHHLLSTAKIKMEFYTSYRKDIKRFEEDFKKKAKEYKDVTIMYVTIGCFLIFPMVTLMPFILLESSLGINNGVLPLIGIISYIALIYYSSKFRKKRRKKKISEYEIHLSELQKHAEEAANEFRVVVRPYGFPQEYWNEGAITQMLRYVENKMADNWKEIVNKYEEHLDHQYGKYLSDANSRGETASNKDEWRKGLMIATGILGVVGTIFGASLHNASKDIGRY
jgi:hypothetical protein